MEGKKIVREMNRTRLIPIVGLPPVVTVLSLGVAVMTGVLYSWLAGITLFAAVIVAGRWINKTEVKFIELFFLSLTTGTEYDPALLEDMNDFPGSD